MSASRGFADVPPDLFERGVRNPTVAVLEEILNGLSWPNDKARIAPAATGSNDAAPLFRIDQTHLSCAKLDEICGYLNVTKASHNARHRACRTNILDQLQ